jgi:hypothetical protein
MLLASLIIICISYSCYHSVEDLENKGLHDIVKPVTYSCTKRKENELLHLVSLAFLQFTLLYHIAPLGYRTLMQKAVDFCC